MNDDIDFDNLKKDDGIRIIKNLLNENKNLKKEIEFLSKTNTYTLSKNLVKVLISIAENISLIKENYIHTDLIYGTNYKGSNTAFLTQLKYIGALIPFFTEDDLKKRSKRSGKWQITREGYLFLNRDGKLPLKVTVKDQVVINKEKFCFIDDKKLKWKTESDIWQDLKKFEDRTNIDDKGVDF